CRPGFYKSAVGNAECSKCPPHSVSHHEGALYCACEKNYYRAGEDPASMACTRPPSAPRNVISVINETSVILDWSWPEDTGGRRDLFFTVLCKRCQGPPSAPRNVISVINETSVILDWSWPEDTGGRRDLFFTVLNVRFLPWASGLRNTTVTVTDLLAHTNYTFQVEAQNGVSGQAPALRKYAAVTITTNQAEDTGGRRDLFFTVLCKRCQAPSPVTVIRKESTSRNSISLSWLEPERPNGIILDYEVKYYEKQEQETSYTILRARACNVMLSGLKADTAYLLQFRARTAAGYGASSRSFEIETSPDCEEGKKESSVATANPNIPTRKDTLATVTDPSQAVHEFAKELDASCIAIDKVVGVGEFGEVCSGRLKLPSKKEMCVAIKMLKAGYTDQQRRDFLAEASIMGQFDHPNIIRLEGVVTR
ncbi:hypothetical protein CRUP_023966, partial [Coryphaenoides rupestris]